MSFEYPRAGLNAPPGVQAEIARFRRLPTIVTDQLTGRTIFDKSQVPLLFHLLGSGASPYLMSKTDAAYQERPVAGQRCGNCSSAYVSVVEPHVAVCSQVEGTIGLDSYCRLWNTDRK